MDSRKIVKNLQKKRAVRVRAKLFGTADCPRLNVHKSNTHVYLQLIDDENQRTIVSVSTVAKKGAKEKSLTVKELGSKIADLAKEKKVSKAIFDRGRYKYHGLVKEIAESARKGGLKI